MQYVRNPVFIHACICSHLYCVYVLIAPTRDRFALLGDLWGAVAQPDLSVDLVLHSTSEAARRAQEQGSLVQQAIHEGVLLHGHS